MRLFALCVLLVAAVAVGCKKAPPPSEESLARRRPPSFYATSAPPVIVVADSGDVNANLAQLSLALRKYIAGTHRVPADFDDFVAKSGVRPPPPPLGKKYTIQGEAVALVKQ